MRFVLRVLSGSFRWDLENLNNSTFKVTPFVGISNFTSEICKLMQSVSENTASVLVKGERGTGKRLFAENVHSLYSQKECDLFEINCRLDVKNVTNQIKRFANYVLTDNKVNRKTVFFESVDCLSVELQNYVFQLIKKIKSADCNCKIISSSEKNLEELIGSGSFNPDLFYQINSVVLNFIPLRNRKEDIPKIASYYFRLFGKKSGIKFEGFSEDAKKALVYNFWGGNVDELINSIQRAFIVGKDSFITVQDLGLDRTEDVVSKVNESGLPDKSLKTAIDTFKKEYVTKILEENGWNQTKAARILGIQRTYVIRLINELQIRDK